jgi:hypothetical protein
MASVVRTAKASGMAAEAETPATLFRKIPLEMKRLGFATRGLFDDIAAEAGKTGDAKRVVSQLAAAMNNCIACHAAFSFVEEGK